MKKLFAVLLSLSLTLSLAACGNDPAESSGASQSPAVSQPAAGDYVTAYTQTVAGADPDTVMFTVDGIDVTAEYFFYWLAYDCYSLDYQHQVYLGAPLDFDETASDGSTTAEYLKDDARKWTTVYLLLEREAQAIGAGVTQEQQAQWEEQKANYIAQQGQEGFDRLLREQGLSEEAFDRISCLGSFLIGNVQDAMPAPTEEEAETYRTENSVYGAKHILILTAEEGEDGTVALSTGGAPTNEDGSAFTGTAEEYNTAALARVQDILNQINEAEDPLAAFDALMNLYSQDTGLQSNPDGYTFTPDTSFVDEFKDAVYGLEIGQYSGIVESAFGYHILLRTCPDVTEDYRAQQMNALIDGWAETEYTPTPAYESLDVKSFYEKYIAYAESFYEAEEPSASPEG